MTRWEKIAASFTENFKVYKKENIVIYGTGEYALWIGETFKDYNIRGFLDRWKNGGEICGKPILSYKEIKDKQISIIIIAASADNTESIRLRIAGFCNDLGIRLYSLEGTLLNNPIENPQNFERLQDFEDFDIEEIIKNSRYYDCEKAVHNSRDKVYWRHIKRKFLRGDYNIDMLGRLHIDTAYDIGYLFLGPLVTDFLLWLTKVIRENESHQVFFAARDGYLFKQLYDVLRTKKEYVDLPESVYLYTSRYVCMLSELYCEEDIRKCADVFFDGSLELMLEKRFLLNENEIFPRDDYLELDSIEYILLHKDIILRKAGMIRQNYIKYLEKQKIGASLNAVFFDLAASGTCQKVIEKISGQKLIGTYFLRMLTAEEEKQRLNILNYQDYDDNLALHSMIMECVLTSFEPTMCYMDECLTPVFANESRNNEEIRFVKEAQNGICDFYNKVLDDLNYQDNVDSVIPILLFNHITSYYTKINNQTFDRYVMKDEIFNLQNSISNKCIV